MNQGRDQIIKAAAGGHLDCLVYIRKEGCEWDKKACRWAARHGHIDYRFKWDEYACSRGTEGGHLNCLKYLYEHGCEWNKWVFSCAARAVHLGS